MTYEDLILEKGDGVATVTLNVPEKLNAMTGGMERSLMRVSEELGKDDDVRVVIVTGAGRGFCSGADVSTLAGGGEGPEVLPRHRRLELIGPNGGAEAFLDLEKPVIGAINGPCVGAGFSLALSMDIRLASEEARFGAVFVLRGLTPDFGNTYLLPQSVGMSKALELMFTGDVIDAAEAVRLGIVSKVVPPDELMEAANELAAKIVAQPPISVELSKRMAYRRVRDQFARQIELETAAQSVCTGSEDNLAAVQAFLEKRPQPIFKGR